MFDNVRATLAVLTFLGDTRVERTVTLAPPEEEEGEGEDIEDEIALRMYLSLVFPLSFSCLFF